MKPSSLTHRVTSRMFVTLVAVIIWHVGQAQLRLPGLFSDHMVIQQNATVPIWGWSYPTQDVQINVSWDTVTIRTKSDNTSFWKTAVKSPSPGGPHEITITAGGEKHVIHDVLAGEVWLCSGQSNMEWSMAAAGDGKTLIQQVHDEKIRLFDVPASAADSRQIRGEGAWKVCDKNSVADFSAVGYFFGKKLHQDLQVPVGLINSSWGGTPAETWVPAERLDADPVLKEAAALQKDDRPWCPSKPGVVFNAMIHPFVPFRIAGALWYQGESNVGAPYTYKQLMETLIRSWREEFKTDLAFYYVQIAPYKGYGEIEKGTLLREQQVRMQSIPNTGMVVISDLVDDVTDIHPKFKKPVGERLADLALARTYHRPDVVHEYPEYASMTVEKSRIRIAFNHSGAGLMSKGGALTEFLIAGADKKFYPASAKIEGSTVIISAKEVKTPVAVRYAWSNSSMGNLFGKSGLPVSSFRTDNWPIEVR